MPSSCTSEGVMYDLFGYTCRGFSWSFVTESARMGWMQEATACSEQSRQSTAWVSYVRIVASPEHTPGKLEMAGPFIRTSSTVGRQSGRTIPSGHRPGRRLSSCACRNHQIPTSGFGRSIVDLLAEQITRMVIASVRYSVTSFVPPTCHS